MDSLFVLGIAVVALYVLLRHYAARRVAAGQGQFIWLMFVPTLIGAVVITWAGIQMVATVSIAGMLMVVAGAVYLAVLLRFLVRASRSVSSTGPQDDIGAALTGPVVDYMTTIISLWLIGGLVALVGLIVWGVTQAR
jgi:hypothetical protein